MGGWLEVMVGGVDMKCEVFEKVVGYVGCEEKGKGGWDEEYLVKKGEE